MATVIDSLVVALGLDATKFHKGIKDSEKAHKLLTTRVEKDDKEREQSAHKLNDAEKKRHKEFQERGEKTAETLGFIRRHALGLIAVLAGGVGLVEFAKSTLFSAASLGRLSHNMGMSIKDLQGWEYAAKSVGGSGSDMAKNLESASLALAGMKYNGQVSSGLQEYYRFGGGQFGMPANAQQLLLNESAMVSKIYAAGHHNEAMSRWLAMGNSSDSFNLAKQGPQAMMKLVDEGKRLSAVNRAQANASEREQHALATFGATLKKTATAIAFEFLPTFNRMLQKFQQFANWVLGHEGQILAWIHAFIAGVRSLATEINRGVQSLGGWKVVLGTLAALKLASMASGLISLASGLFKVAGGLRAIGTAGALTAGLWAGKHINSWINDLVSLETKGKHKSLGGWLASGRVKARQNDFNNHNPGGLLSWGATAIKHGQAYFANRGAGETAMAQMLSGMGSGTLSSVVSRYGAATGSPLNLSQIVGATGYKSGQMLDMSNPSVVAHMMHAIIAQKQGRSYASQFQAKAILPTVRQAIHTTHANVTVHVHMPSGSDGPSVVRAIKNTLKPHLVAQSNTGMS